MATERDTAEHRRYRREFCTRLLALKLQRLVFIDESFCKTGMRREYGWARSGHRVGSTRPHRSWRTISLVGAIRVGHRPLLMTHVGSIDGARFLEFTKQRLCPWLRPGDVVLMDNLNIHKMQLVRAAIQAVGATPVYLPTYSPELNPIELLWAHLKRGLRRLAIDQVPALRQAVRRLRTQVPFGHIDGWFREALRHAQCN